MPRRSSKKAANGNERERRVVAQEAARIIVNQGVRDYRVAKMKAADRLGLNTRGSLPGNAEIQQALEEHHLLFGGDSHADLMRTMREAALAAMELLSSFTPRLVGPVLAGTADANSAVNLHVFSDSVEAIAMTLSASDIQYRPYERRLKSRRDQTDTYAGFEFALDTAHVQATVFPVDGIRQAPLSPIDGKPMERADSKRVQELL
ncbi:MAG: hypothetical protein QNJ00_01355 [Woeseiaceae bacterium]|nr:hypothetical protein [Woeseiaceae bacterium]